MTRTVQRTDSRAPGGGEGMRWLRENVNHAGDSCLMWPMHSDDKGYAIVALNGRLKKASRVMCELAYGPPPMPRHEAAHSCGRGHKACVNPRHLSWKTRSENQRDRRRHGTHGRPGVYGKSKLTPEDIGQIRALSSTTTHKELARKFNCTPSNISKILSGARWKATPKWLQYTLTRAEIEAIRKARGTKSRAELAKQYGVKASVIDRIHQGKQYAHFIR